MQSKTLCGSFFDQTFFGKESLLQKQQEEPERDEDYLSLPAAIISGLSTSLVTIIPRFKLNACMNK